MRNPKRVGQKRKPKAKEPQPKATRGVTLYVAFPEPLMSALVDTAAQLGTTVDGVIGMALDRCLDRLDISYSFGDTRPGRKGGRHA